MSIPVCVCVCVNLCTYLRVLASDLYQIFVAVRYVAQTVG